MSRRSSIRPLLPGAENKGAHGGYEDKDETRQPLPFSGHAQRPNDQAGPFTLYPAQSARLAPGTQPPWFRGAPLPAGEKWPAAEYFACAGAEFLESLGEPVAAGSHAESTVRSTWRATDAPELAAGTAAIPVERAADPSAVADHSPPSAAVETAAGSNAAARKVGKRPVLVPLGSGGIARWGRSNPISFLRIPKVIKSTLSLESIEHVPWRKLGHVGRDWRFINNYTNGSLVSATSQDHRSGQPGYQSRI